MSQDGDTESSGKSVMKSVFKRIEEWYVGKAWRVGIPTGFNGFDDRLFVLQKGELIVVSGDIGTGKTTFLINAIRHIACNKIAPIAIVSCGLPRDEFAMRLLIATADVSSKNMLHGFIKVEDWRKLLNAAGSITDADIEYINGPNLSSLVTALTDWAGKHPGGLIVVDGMDYLNSSPCYTHPRNERIDNAASQLKSLALNCDVPVLVTCSKSTTYRNYADTIINLELSDHILHASVSNRIFGLTSRFNFSINQAFKIESHGERHGGENDMFN